MVKYGFLSETTAELKVDPGNNYANYSWNFFIHISLLKHMAAFAVISYRFGNEYQKEAVSW